MISRQTYFPLVTDKVSKFLSQYVDKEAVSEMWLEYEGQPLKWLVLPLVTDKVSKFLSLYVDKEAVSEMWLEYEGQPLKWLVLSPCNR